MDVERIAEGARLYLVCGLFLCVRGWRGRGGGGEGGGGRKKESRKSVRGEGEGGILTAWTRTEKEEEREEEGEEGEGEAERGLHASHTDTQEIKGMGRHDIFKQKIRHARRRERTGRG